MQLLRICYSLFADGVVFQIVPDPLVRVEFRRIRRQKEKAESLFDFFRFDKSFDDFGFMRRMSINNQKNRIFRSVKKTLDKFKKCGSANTAFDGHEAKLSLSIDR